jgi:hypothetical protein
MIYSETRNFVMTAYFFACHIMLLFDAMVDNLQSQGCHLTSLRMSLHENHVGPLLIIFYHSFYIKSFLKDKTFGHLFHCFLRIVSYNSIRLEVPYWHAMMVHI